MWFVAQVVAYNEVNDSFETEHKLIKAENYPEAAEHLVAYYSTDISQYTICSLWGEQYDNGLFPISKEMFDALSEDNYR